MLAENVETSHKFTTKKKAKNFGFEFPETHFNRLYISSPYLHFIIIIYCCIVIELCNFTATFDRFPVQRLTK